MDPGALEAQGEEAVFPDRELVIRYLLADSYVSDGFFINGQFFQAAR
jgi:hypothetical protein